MSSLLQWSCFNDFQYVQFPKCHQARMLYQETQSNAFDEEAVKNEVHLFPRVIAFVTSSHFKPLHTQRIPSKTAAMRTTIKNEINTLQGSLWLQRSWLLAHLRPDFLKLCIAHRRSHLDRDSTGHHLASPIITLIFHHSTHSIWFDHIRYH